MKLPSLLRFKVQTCTFANLNVSSTDPTCKLIQQRTPKNGKEGNRDLHVHVPQTQAGSEINPNFALSDFMEFEQCSPPHT